MKEMLSGFPSDFIQSAANAGNTLIMSPYISSHSSSYFQEKCGLSYTANAESRSQDVATLVRCLSVNTHVISSSLNFP